MYEFNRSVARLIGDDHTWETPDIGVMPCNEIFTKYREVYAVLQNNFIEGALTLDLSKIRTKIETLSVTFDAWLVQNGNKSLPTVEGIPTVKYLSARYGDAYDAGYTLKGTDSRYSPEMVVTPEHQVDVLISKPDTDYQKLVKNCLFTVNGLFHRASASPAGVYLVKGGDSCNLINDTQVGILNFQDVCEFECLSFMPGYFKQPIKLLDYKDKIFIKFPRKLSGKTLCLVLGGFLLTPDQDVFKLVNDDTLIVNMNRIPYHRFFYETLRRAKLETMGLNTTGDDRRVVQELDSNEAIKQYFLLPHSFLILLNSTDITVREDRLADTGIPGRWEYHTYPQGLLRVSDSTHPEYRVLEQEGVYVLATRPQYRDTVMRETIYSVNEGAIDNHKIGAISNHPAHATLIRVLSSKVTIAKAA